MKDEMKRFVIEREIPKVGSLNHEQLQKAATKSNEVLRQLGPDIQWVEAYIAADKMFCVYLGKEEEIIHRHAELRGCPPPKSRKWARSLTARPESNRGPTAIWD